MEDFDVIWRFNFPVKKTVICKETNMCAWREAFTDVINIDKKEERTKNSSLRDTRKDFTRAGETVFNNDMLETVRKEGGHPV